MVTIGRCWLQWGPLIRRGEHEAENSGEFFRHNPTARRYGRVEPDGVAGSDIHFTEKTGSVEMRDSDNLFNGLLGLGMAAIVGYGAYKGVEYLANSQRQAAEEERQRRLNAARSLAWAQQAEQERQQKQLRERLSQMDSAVDQLIANPGAALEVIRDCVPQMEENNWKIFAGLLAKKSEQSPVARGILGVAHYTRQAVEEITQLIGHSLDEAVSLVHDIWDQKDQAEQVGFLLALHAQAKSSVRAKALLGRLTA